MQYRKLKQLDRLVLGKENQVATIIPIWIVLRFIPDDGMVAVIYDDLDIAGHEIENERDLSKDIMSW